jgi:hypothetical protein
MQIVEVLKMYYHLQNLFLLVSKINSISKEKNQIIEIIKLLIYKENSYLLAKINFEDDNTFLEPLLFAYFNSKKDNSFPKEMLKEIFQA